MTVANFEELTKGFCELAQVPTPTLEPDSAGMLAFHICVADVNINVIYMPQSCVDHAFILVEFGSIPEDKERDAWRALMEANFLLLQARAPSFSLNPTTGDVVLQYAYSFFEATPEGFFKAVNSIADVATQWRENFFLNDPQEEDVQPDTVTGITPANFA
jgi:hypothetical protein